MFRENASDAIATPAIVAFFGLPGTTALVSLLDGRDRACRAPDRGWKSGVVGNGHLTDCKLLTGMLQNGRAPKVRAKTGEPANFRFALVLPYVPKTKPLKAALPWLYLNGMDIQRRDE